MPKIRKKFIGYAPIGSHGGLFSFDGGKIAEAYPTLYEIYRKKLLPNYKKVCITYEPPTKKGKGKMKGVLNETND